MVLFGVFFEQFLLNVCRDEFVGGKLHGERRASAGDGTKFGGVVGHFLERHLGLNFLQTILFTTTGGLFTSLFPNITKP